MRWLSYQVMRWLGWRFEGTIPDLPKMVVIGAPHTSNWDFFLFLGALHHFDLRVRFLAKDSLFRWPMGAMFRWMGGIPVDRSRAGGVVRQVEEAFATAATLILVIAPEGTRHAASAWKSGFIEIAEGAGVPIVLAGVDGTNKVLRISPSLTVDADRSRFMNRVRDFYADHDGLRPEGKGPVVLVDEATRS